MAILPSYAVTPLVVNSECEGVQMSQLPVPFTTVGLTIEALLSITDTPPIGEAFTGTAEYFVIDSTPPSLSCTPQVILDASATTCNASLPSMTLYTNATDNCGSTTVSQSISNGTELEIGNTTITVFGQDHSRNVVNCTTVSQVH